ncbi:MAG: SDR family oxidoreductase [Alphaproteobacteria bacterium]|nr:SDR family oxidoreductase [Alphaproteobacteria bacterium]
MDGKVATITGAGSGIARAAANIFAREGASVGILELNEELGRACEAEIRAAGGEASFFRTDVTEEASVKAGLDAAAGRYGKLNVLFNCAGGSIAEDARVTEVDLSVWDFTINLDLKGPFLCSRHGIPHLIRAGGGAIVNVASVVALKGSFPAMVYTTAKGGVVSFTRALAGQYYRDNIRANVICPGMIMTDRIKKRFGGNREGANTDQAQALNDMGMARYPFGVGAPEDIARIALFLASDESRMVNGAVVPADGGMSAY